MKVHNGPLTTVRLLKRFSRAMGAFCVLAALNAAPVQAHNLDQSVTVRTHDLDLATDAGARRLLRRLDHAVELVCGGSFLQQFSAGRRAYQNCYDQTMAETLARLDAPRVHAHYAQRRARASQRGRGQPS
jgi:UrcA family protein